MAAILMKESQGGEDGGVIETISIEILQGLSNVFVASSKTSTVSLNDEDKKAVEVSGFLLITKINNNKSKNTRS